MHGRSIFVVRLAVLVAAAFIAGCSAMPTSPSVVKKPHVDVFRDGEPCDSTVVTDGTCVDGYIIPW